ncbi:MAG: hypothetical protein IJJ04_00110 [Clostridia bacterium]|nr:hypothetical protein [Clostridia bacterium]
MRTKNSLMNSIAGCFSYAVIMLGSFITRKFFTEILGLQYAGIETNFPLIISALAIVEMGLGIGISYKLYKPIANKDWEQVSVILCFLRKLYIIIAAAVLALGLAAVYFVVTPMQGDFSKLWLSEIFILYVLDVVVSYLYSHKRSMIIADQKNHINNNIHTLAQVLMFASQIAILKIFGSFELYVICRIVSKLVENVLISYMFDKKYPFINLKIKTKLPSIEKKDLFKNMKALFVHKITSFSTTVFSSLIIMYVLGLEISGIYGNHMMIVMALITVTNEVFNGVIASFGNLLNTENREKVYNNFNVLYFFNFLIYSFIICSFVSVITPFMGLWIGIESALGIGTIISIAGYLYINGIRQSIGMAKVSAGIYDPDKYIVLFGAIITFIVSFILLKPLGIAGVMIGNVVGVMAIPYWVQPYLVYDEVFKKSVKTYHFKFALYTALTSIYCFFCYEVGAWAYKNHVTDNMAYTLSHIINRPFSELSLISQVIFNMLVCIFIPNLINILVFCRTKEFKDLWKVTEGILKRSKKQ